MRYQPAPGRAGLKTESGGIFPADGAEINPGRKFYARMIADGDLVPATAPGAASKSAAPASRDNGKAKQ